MIKSHFCCVNSVNNPLSYHLWETSSLMLHHPLTILFFFLARKIDDTVFVVHKHSLWGSNFPFGKSIPDGKSDKKVLVNFINFST
jgi:hypothetical protein